MISIKDSFDIDFQPGEISFFAYDKPEGDGWLDLDQPLLASEYPELFQAIGYTFGGAAGLFDLPTIDNFVRCLNVEATGLDPSRAPFSEQLDDVEDHSHPSVLTSYAGSHYHILSSLTLYGGTSSFTGGGSGYATMKTSGQTGVELESNGNHGHSATIGNNDGTETAPRHIKLKPMIFAGGDYRLAYHE